MAFNCTLESAVPLAMAVGVPQVTTGVALPIISVLEVEPL